ncbi:MAG: hypothetical protein ACI8RZ_006845 [Myxococcota bacterium]|jgi:hypothetical protein
MVYGRCDDNVVMLKSCGVFGVCGNGVLEAGFGVLGGFGLKFSFGWWLWGEVWGRQRWFRLWVGIHSTVFRLGPSVGRGSPCDVPALRLGLVEPSHFVCCRGRMLSAGGAMIRVPFSQEHCQPARCDPATRTSAGAPCTHRADCDWRLSDQEGHGRTGWRPAYFIHLRAVSRIGSSPSAGNCQRFR